MTDKKVELKPEVQEMSEKLRKAIKYDKEGQGTVADGVYTEMLPEGLTEAQVRQVYDHNVNFVAALAHAAGTDSVDLMAKHKNIQETYVKVPMIGRDYAEAIVNRTRETVNPKERDQKIVKHGAVTMNIRQFAGSNAGQLKTARQLVGELAVQMLAG